MTCRSFYFGPWPRLLGESEQLGLEPRESNTHSRIATYVQKTLEEKQLTMTIALIGAGAAGAACASVLRSKRAEYCLVDKARGVGGRLATRRVTAAYLPLELSYDHGAPCFDLPQGLREQLYPLLDPATLQPFGMAYVASPAMPQLIKDLLGVHPVSTLSEVDLVHGTPGQWWLRLKQTATQTLPVAELGPYKRVVITAPAPQALRILADTDCSWKAVLNDVLYEPCFALMLTIASERPTEPPLHDTMFASFTSQNQKPSRAVPSGLQSWVGHTTPEWTRMHIDKNPSDITEALLPEALQRLSASKSTLVHADAHRWRFATVTHALTVDFLADDKLGLYYASDACRGLGVASALLSGLALGQHLCSSD